MQRKKSMFQGMASMASEICVSLSNRLASASATAVKVVCTPDPSHQFQGPKKQISDEKDMPELYLKKKRRAPLAAQVEELPVVFFNWQLFS